MSEPAQDTAAVAAVLRRAQPGTDPHITATEIIAVLRTRGWRPTPAQPSPSWRTPPGHHPARGDTVHAIAAQARQAITNAKGTP